MHIVQLIVNGLLLGGFYALLGIGLTMIFGIMGVMNLSHGDFVILGAYASACLSQALGVDPVLSLLVTVPLMFLLGVLMQRLLLERAMKKGAESALLVTFGISIILKDLLLILFTADARHISTAYSLSVLHIGGIDISLLNLVLFCISLVYILSLNLLLGKTHTGRAIRAVSDDSRSAMLSGINVSRIRAVTTGLALASAAVAGLCVGMRWTFYPSSGGNYLLIAFIVVSIGGLNSLGGTLLAGLVFGLSQVIGGANYGLLISYALLLLIMIIKPKGLLGS